MSIKSLDLTVKTPADPVNVLHTAGQAERWNRIRMETKKKTRWVALVISAIAIIALQYLTVPILIPIVDALFGITWSMTPVYLTWWILVTVAIIISLLIRSRLKPIARRVIWFILTLIVVSFSVTTLWAEVVSSMP